MDKSTLQFSLDIAAITMRVDPNALIAHDRHAAVQGDQFATISELMAFNGELLTVRQQDELRRITDTHLARYAAIMAKAFPGSVRIYSEEELIEFVTAKASALLAADDNAHLLILDRGLNHVLKQALPQAYAGRLHYLSLTRSHGSLYTSAIEGKTHRAGDLPLAVQWRAIMDKLPASGYLVPLDDSIAEAGTLRVVQSHAEQNGIAVRIDQSIAGVKITRNPGTSPDCHFPNVAFVHTRSFLCTEAREAFAGGQLLTIDEHKIGFQVPFMRPFSDGSGYRIQRMLHLSDLSDELLQLNIDYFDDLGTLIGRPLLLCDLRRSIPTDEGLCIPRAFLAQAGSEGRGAVDGAAFSADDIERLLRASVMDYLQFARGLIRGNDNRPPISTVCLDIDGTKTSLRNLQGQVGFKGSVLEAHVREKSLQLLRDSVRSITGMEPSEQYLEDQLVAVDAEHGLATYFVQNHATFLEAEYARNGYRARIEGLFVGFYGCERGLEEAARFIASMPIAYHAFRVRVWDHDTAAIYPLQSEAREFLEALKASGVRVIDVTAALRIHALKTLTYMGLTSEHVDELYAVEDLYNPELLEKGVYRERDKGVVLSALTERNILPAESVMMGDQNHSDIRPAQDLGWFVYPVHGPGQLKMSLRYMRLTPRSDMRPRP